jgi:hypothetical protein
MFLTSPVVEHHLTAAYLHQQLPQLILRVRRHAYLGEARLGGRAQLQLVAGRVRQVRGGQHLRHTDISIVDVMHCHRLPYLARSPGILGQSH